MKFSLLIIVALLCAYTTWVQKTAREVITSTTAREEELRAKLRCSESARIRAESTLEAARKDIEKLTGRTGFIPENPGPIAEIMDSHDP